MVKLEPFSKYYNKNYNLNKPSFKNDNMNK